jgi:alpha-beta hydrolase superfamily lysophospholipase
MTCGLLSIGRPGGAWGRRIAILAAVLALGLVATGGLSAEDAPFPSPEEARAAEAATTLPLSSFYDVVDGTVPAAGGLLRIEEATDYQFLPDTPSAATGIRVYRLLYGSRDVDGGTVPASGVVLLPYGEAPASGWPVVVWAHGTSGVGRMAAPSLSPFLIYGFEGLLEWPLLGYAVVAPDYAGLGTNVPHQYVVAGAQANDLRYGFAAARRALPELGESWVAVGHSQGARAVIALATGEDATDEQGLLGGIAIAPGGDVEEMVVRIASSRYRGYLAFMAFGIRAVAPGFDYREFLSPDAARLMPAAETGGWLTTMATFADGVAPGAMLAPNWAESAGFRRYAALSMPIDGPARVPLLIMAGGADDTTPPAAVAATVERVRAKGGDVAFLVYPGLDHDPLVFGSFRDQFRWVEARFAAPR